MIELNKIYNEDCLEGIKRISDESIDAVISDPPYFLGMTHNGKKGDFSDLAICAPFYSQLFNEFKRVLKKESGSAYFFCDWRSYAFYYPLISNTLGAKNLFVWDKGGGPGSVYNFEHELIIFSTRKTRLHGVGSNVIKNIKGFSGGAKSTNGEKVHPTQKTVELLEKLILDSTSEGDTILDCFIGSGTTAVAAMRNNRNFIGFELQEKYYNIANERIAAAIDNQL